MSIKTYFSPQNYHSGSDSENGAPSDPVHELDQLSDSDCESSPLDSPPISWASTGDLRPSSIPYVDRSDSAASSCRAAPLSPGFDSPRSLSSVRLPPKRSRSPTPTLPDKSAVKRVVPQAGGKSQAFRLQSKNIFLTFPQCAYPLDDFFDRLRRKYPDPKNRIACSREQHEDGQWHLHALLLLDKPLRSTDVRLFDSLVVPPKHPNIRSKLKSIPETLRYVMKGSDATLLRSSFDWQKFLSLSGKKKSTKFLDTVDCVDESIRKRITDPNKILDSLHLQDPAFFAGHIRHLRDYVSYRAVKARRDGFALAQLQPVSVSPALGHSSSSNLSLATWINLNIRQPRIHRQRQLWLKASPGVGKTTLIQNLMKDFSLSVYFWPKEENWHDGYSDGAYDLIVLDEFKAHKKITQLNPMLSGDIHPLSRRNDAPYLKHDILPVMILSNYLPQECYHKATSQALDPLLDRLTIVDFGDDLIRLVPSIPDCAPDLEIPLELPLIEPVW